MLHRTLIPSSSPPPPSLSLYFKSASYSFPLGRLQPPSLVRPLVYSSCTQVEREAKMEEALKSSLRPESSLSSAHQHQQQQQQNKGTLNDEGSWAAEGGNLSGEGFSVDDLLNLGDYAENDKEAEEAEVVEEVEAKAEAAQAEHKERGDSNSSSPPSSYTSVLFFQPPPPPPPPPLLSDIIPPTHVAEELEWVSFIIDDSLSEIPHCPTVAHFPLAPHHKEADTSAAATAQPGASSLSPAVCGRSTEPMVPAKAKRSKRSRSAAPFAAWCMSGRLPFADSASSTTNSTTSCSASSSCSSSSNTSTSCLIYDHHPAACADQSFLLYGDQPPPAAARKHGPKKRDRKPKPSAASAGSGEWRCSHCGVQKTPQWRAGPLGAKTLCNACGVRFKSGRLLPEYRPACSPTFVSHIHSNSHRKVLEMRRKKESELPLSASAQPVASF